MKKLLISFSLSLISLSIIVIHSQTNIKNHDHKASDLKVVFTPNTCAKISCFIKENYTLKVLCIDLLRNIDSSLSYTKADLIIRNNLNIHKDYALACLIYMYKVYGRFEIYNSLKRYLTAKELKSVDNFVIKGLDFVNTQEGVKNKKRKRELKEYKIESSNAEQDAINKAISGHPIGYSVDENYVPVDLNDYGKKVYPLDTLTDWNATETDARMDSILKANNIFYKDNVGWVIQKSKNEPISGRILLTKNIQPVFNKDIEGKITVNITVNENGDVISVSIGSPTSISDIEMRSNALEAAKRNKFSHGNGIATGSITYYLRLH